MSTNSSTVITHALALLAGVSAGVLAYSIINKSRKSDEDSEYTIANQPQRFANAKASKNTRVLNIDAVYNPSFVRGKTILVTGNKNLLNYSISFCIFRY